jgi:hypothetical protein
MKITKTPTVLMSSRLLKQMIQQYSEDIKEWDGPHGDDFFDMFARRKELKTELARRWCKPAAGGTGETP